MFDSIFFGLITVSPLLVMFSAVVIDEGTKIGIGYVGVLLMASIALMRRMTKAEDKIDAKFEKLNSKLDSKIEQIQIRLDTLPCRTRMFCDQKADDK